MRAEMQPERFVVVPKYKTGQGKDKQFSGQIPKVLLLTSAGVEFGNGAYLSASIYAASEVAGSLGNVTVVNTGYLYRYNPDYLIKKKYLS